jgi:hypothetical protein
LTLSEPVVKTIKEFFGFQQRIRSMYFGFSVPQLVWLGIVGLLVISIVVTTAKAFSLGRNRRGVQDIVDTVDVHCVSCDWKGEVPRLRRRCPMCGGSNFAA